MITYFISIGVFLFILLIGVIVLLRYSERNRLQKTLAAILAVWALILSSGLIRAIVEDSNVLMLNSILNFNIIIVGIVAFFTFMIYPIFAIHPALLNLKRSIIFLTPLFITLIVYSIWHIINDIPLNKQFYSFNELFIIDNIPIVIMRLLLLLNFIMYIFIILRSLIRLIPIYQRYIDDNYANSSHNISWLKIVVIISICISFVFLILVFYHNVYTIAIYTMFSASSFAILIDNAMSHKELPASHNLNIKWNYKYGWKVEGIIPKVKSVSSYSKIEIFSRFKEWLKNTKPYHNIDFSVKMVKQKFTDSDYNAISEILTNKGYTFQSYIRKIRIDEACKIMANNADNLSNTEIGNKVGFNHYSSFCRAFTIVTNKSPKQYCADLIYKDNI